MRDWSETRLERQNGLLVRVEVCMSTREPKIVFEQRSGTDRVQWMRK